MSEQDQRLSEGVEVNKTPMEEAYSEYVMGGFTVESYATHKGITEEAARDLITIGRRLHISNTKDIRETA